MKAVQLTGRKQWKIAWFKNGTFKLRNERCIERLMKHVVRIWHLVVFVIVIAIAIGQSRWTMQDKHYSKSFTSTNRNFKMKMISKQGCQWSNKVILNRKVSATSGDEPGKITESDFDVEFCIDMKETSLKS